MGKFYEDLKQVLGFKEQRSNNNILEERNGYGGIGALMFGSGGSYNQEKSMLLSTVYRCVELISSSVATLPFEIYKVDSKGYKKKWQNHPAYHILNCEPNLRMSIFTFMKLMVQSMLLRGNAYAYIVRNAEGNVEQLLYIPSEYVTIKPPKYIYQPVTYSIVGFVDEVEAKDLIHIINFSYDGINGISTLTFARNTLELSANAETHAKNFFSNGCAVGGILQASTTLSAKQKTEVKQSWNQAFGTKTGGQTNGVAVLEGGWSYSPITISSKEAQLLETRQWSVSDIARFFNVNPILCYDNSKSSYASAEMANLSFLTETLQPLLVKFELEFKRKLFKDHSNLTVKFDVAELLRADKTTQSAYFRELISNGILTPNEARKSLNLLPVEGGDDTYMQANMLSLKEVAKNRPANSAINNPIKETETPDKEEEKEPIKEEETQP